mgnify:CR=1 FL=1
MRVALWLKEAEKPIEFDGVANTQQKGSFYCIFIEGGEVVFKYPIADIFRIVESYPPPTKKNDLKS